MRLVTRPRFSLDEVASLAATYSYRNDADAADAGRRAGQDGFYSRDDFLEVCGWKSARTRRLWADPVNSAQVIEGVTRVALATDVEQLKIGALLVLRGVDWPTASTLLHFAAAERYPILDYRALWSLGNDKRPTYTFDLWWAYTEACRRLAKQAGVTLRELDRALWQYAKTHQPPGLTPDLE